jgi:hypothetical protein
MNHHSNQTKSTLEIMVIDRRNSAQPECSQHRDTLTGESEDGIVFLASWKFPAPANRLRTTG